MTGSRVNRRAVYSGEETVWCWSDEIPRANVGTAAFQVIEFFSL